MENKKILFISNIYLPQKTGGTQRICKFFECLNENPLETLLITTKDYFSDNLKEKNIFRTHDLFQYFKTKKNRKIGIKKKYDFATFIKKNAFLFFCFPDEHATFIFFSFLV